MLNLSSVLVTIYWWFWSFAALAVTEHEYFQQTLAEAENEGHAFTFWVRHKGCGLTAWLDSLAGLIKGLLVPNSAR